MSTDRKVLRYGYVLRLHGDNQQQPQGLIVSKGFIQRSVYYQTYASLDNINNYRESLFQVLPKGSFEIHDEFIKSSQNPKDNALFLHRMQTELEQYLSFAQTKHNEEVLFGQEIVLKHMDSQAYLSGSYECSDFSTDAFKVQLSKVLSSQTLFKVRPFKTYQREGQRIYFDEPIVLMNEQQRFYLDYVEDKQVLLDRARQLGSDESGIVTSEVLEEIVRTPMPECRRYETIITHNGKTSWRFRLHETNEQQRKSKTLIKAYDLVQLQYTKDNSYLSVDLQSNSVVLKELKDITQPLPLDAVWELQPMTEQRSRRKPRPNLATSVAPLMSQMVSPTLNVESQFVEEFGQYSRLEDKSKREYIFRNFMTGRTLTVVQNDRNLLVPELTLTSMDQGFEIGFAKQGESELGPLSFVNIRYGNTTLQHLPHSRPRFRTSQHQRASSDSGMKRLMKEDLDYMEHDVAFLEGEISHAFQISKIDRQLKEDLLFTISGQEDLYLFVQILQSHESQSLLQELNQRLLNGVIAVLRQLVCFVQNLAEDENPDHHDGQPNRNRQKCLKDLFIIEMLMQILFQATKKGLLQQKPKEWKTEREKVGQIFKLSYMLIKILTKNNKQIKLHVSQWLQLFLSQAMIIDESTVQASLAELLDDNYHAISKFITQESIAGVVEILKEQQPHEKYLKILSSVCICQGKAVTSNQHHVLELFFKRIPPQFTFKFKSVNNKVLIHSYINREVPGWRTLHQFHLDSHDTDEGQSWVYFLSFINLLSDVCGFRNRLGQEYATSILPLDVLCSLIEDEAAKETCSLEYFLKLAHYCHVDNTIYQPIRLISRVMEWDNIEDKIEITRTWVDKKYLPENTDLKRIIDFITHYLQQFEYFDRRKWVANQTLLRVLSIIKTSIELGFWQSVADLKQILHELIRLCSCRIDFEYWEDDDHNDGTEAQTPNRLHCESVPTQELRHHFKKAKVKLTKKNPENQLIMQNKILACEILDQILYLEVNVRVIKLTQALKRMQENAGSDVPNVPQQEVRQGLFRNLVQRVVVMLQRTPLKRMVSRDHVQFTSVMPLPRVRKSPTEDDIFHVERWQNEYIQIFSERDLFDQLGEKLQLELVFAEISLFQDPKMLQYALSLLNKINGQRRLLFQNFSKIIILSDKEHLTKQLSTQARQVRAKLRALGEMQNVTNEMIWRESDNLLERGLIQDLSFLCQSLKTNYLLNDGKIERIRLEDLYVQGRTRTILNEQEENEKVHQSLFKAQDMASNVLMFLSQDHDPAQPLVMKLLDICYEFLTLLIWNHPVNKIEIEFDLKEVYNHLQFNIASVDFVRELFSNNKELLYNENEVSRLLQTIIIEINHLPRASPHKSKLLDVLRVLQYDNNKVIKSNQLMTLSQLQEKRYENVMYILKGVSSLKNEKELELSQYILKSNLWNEAAFKRQIQRYNEHYAKGFKEIELDGELMYMATYFSVFSQLIEDGNTINAEKCRQMHPYKALVSILIESQYCWPLQHHVRAYINRLYYRYKDFENVSYILIEFDLKCMARQLELIVALKERNCDKFKEIRIRNATRFSYMFTYVFTALQEILYTLNLILVRDPFLIDLEEALDQHAHEKDWSIHLSLVQIACSLKHIEKLWFKSSYVSNFCQQLTNILQCIFETFSLPILLGIATQLTGKPSESPNDLEEYKSAADREKVEEQAKQSIITYMINYNESKLSDQELKMTRIQQSFKKLFHLKKVKKFHEDIETQNENRELNVQHTKLIKALFESSEFQAFQDEEFNGLCNRLDTLDAISVRIYRSPGIITLRDFIKNIIQMNIDNPQCLDDELKIFFLNVLVRMISERNKNTAQSKPIDEWDPDSWSESKKAIEEEQHLLDECGAASLIFQMFRDTTLEEKYLLISKQRRWQLCSQLIIFTNAFLLGGNTRCQNSILQKLVADSSNSMLINIQQLIRKFSRYVCHTFKSRRGKKSNTTQKNYIVSVVYVDNLQYYSEQQETLKRVITSTIESQKTVMQKQISIQVLWRTFRMLQLLCENNNVDFKRYLLQQSDKDGQVNINSINFVEQATKELRQFLKLLNRDIISVPIQIIDFINEIIQLPCIENQNALCKSTFIEDVCFVSQYFQKKQHIKQRGFEVPEQMQRLHELFSKVIQSIMQILEGNHAGNYEVLQTKLDSKLLTEFIKQTTALHSIGTAVDLEKILRHSQPTFPQELEQVLSVAIIKEKIEAMNPDSRWVRHLMEEVKADEKIEQVFSFCQRNLLKIEIFYEGQQQMVFFPAHPVFRFLSDETRDKIMFNVPRETQRIKLIQLLSEIDAISSEIEYNYKLNQQRIPITHKTITKLVNLAQSLSFLINALMVVFYAVVISEQQQSSLETDFYEEIILHTLGWLQLAISIIIYVFYLISRAPLELLQLQKQQSLQGAKIKKLFLFIWKQAGNVYKVVQGDDFLQYTFYLIISIGGALSNTYYFSLHLFYIFSRLSLLQSVFQAISHNASQLIMVAMLGVLFQYVFSIVGFNNYVDDIYPEKPEDPCHSLLSCMITLMTSGVIGTSMSEWDPLKFLYDTVYFVFFGLLFTNIIAGIMTDTFAALRDERKKIEDDKKNQCYICGIDRSTVEKHQEDFEDHISSKHFLWNYIFYLYCLKKKDSTEYTGLEYWIIDKYGKDNISWFPIVGGETEQDLEVKIDELGKKMDAILEQLQHREEAASEDE